MRVALSAAWLAAASAPAGAQTAASPPVIAKGEGDAEAASGKAEFDALMAFVGQLGEAVAIQVAAMQNLADARPLLESLTTPAAIQANAPKVRAALAKTRSGIERADVLLAQVVAPDLRMAPVSATTLLREARETSAGNLALLGDYDAYLGALLRGDRAAAEKIGPKLLNGAYLMMDGMRSSYLNRQTLVPRNKSVHQVSGVGAQLYRAMGAAGRGWHNAVLARQPEAAAEKLRAELVEIARDARALSREGRANLARELVEFDAEYKVSPEEEAALARLRAALASKAEFFALADEIAALAERAAGDMTASNLASQPTAALLGAFLPIELRFHSAVARYAAVGSGKAQ